MSGVGWRDGVHAAQSRGVLGQSTILGVVLVDVMCIIYCLFWRSVLEKVGTTVAWTYQKG